MDWLTFILIVLMLPFLWQWMRDVSSHIRRTQLVKAMERSRKSTVITIVHKEQKNRLFGMTRSSMIDLDDAGRVLDAVRKTPVEQPIDLVLHTPGGYVIAAEQITEALAEHGGTVTAFVPYYALSGGTLIALAADEIVMDERAVLGRIDPQLLYFPAQSVKKAIRAKGEEKATEPGLVLGDMAQKALRQVQDFMWQILTKKGYSEPVAEVIAGELISDQFLHDAPIFCTEATKWGLRVKTEVPAAVYEIVKFTGAPSMYQ
jgi:ClpP class serine protease